VLYPIAASSGGLIPRIGQSVVHWQKVPRVNPIVSTHAIKPPAKAMHTRRRIAHAA